MLLEKVFETTVNVASPINFCADKDRHLMTILQNRYEGRCFKGSYVVEVVRVLAQSACTIMKTNSSGEGYIDVRFLAKVYEIASWDILTGVEVAVNQPILIGTYAGADKQRAVVSLLASKALETIAVKQKIPVRVVVAQHTPMQTHIAVSGALLTCDREARAVRVRGALDGGARVELEPMLARIEDELRLREKIPKADLWFFEILLYRYVGKATASAPDGEAPSWEGGPVWRGPPALRAPEAPTRSVLEIARRAVQGETVPVTGTWCRSLSLYRSSPLAAVAEAGAAPEAWGEPHDGTPRALFAEMLKNILDFLVATRELTEVYNTKELINSHVNLWAYMRSVQEKV